MARGPGAARRAQRRGAAGLILAWASLALPSAAVQERASASAAEEALLALDVDRSGRVERSDVEAFAAAQGLSAEEVRAEFKDLDLNGDGELDAEEIRSSVGQPETVGPVVAQPAAAKPNAVRRAAPAEAEVLTSTKQAAAPQAPAQAFSSVNSAAAPQDPAQVLTSVNQAFQAASPAASPPAAFSAPLGLPRSGTVDGESPRTQGALALPAAHETSAAAAAAGADGDLEVAAGQQASRALAEASMRSAATALASRTSASDKAAQLEEMARSLRGRAADVRRHAAEQTVSAAQVAVESMLHTTADTVQSLEAKARKLEQQAAARRERAQSALERALQAQAESTASLHNSIQQAA